MRRRLKGLGVALVAVFVLGAVMASGAWGTTHEIVLEGHDTAILTGTNHVGKETITMNTLFGPGTVECVAHLSATVQNGTKEITWHHTLTGCTAFGSEASVTTNHCANKFENAATSTAGDAPVEIECEVGSTTEIDIPALECTLKIGPQTPAGGVHYTNTQTPGKPAEITLHTTVSNVAIAEKVGQCGLITGNTTTTEGTLTVNAWEDNGYGNPTTPTPIEGAQIGVTMSPGG